MATGTIKLTKGFSDSYEIPANTDLNDLITPGTYYCINGTTAATLTHTPINDTDFTLMVLRKGEQCVQVANWGPNVYCRARYSAGFNDWYRYDGHLSTDPAVQVVTGSDMNTIYTSAPTNTMSLIDCSGTSNVPDIGGNHWFGFQWKNSSGTYGFQIVFSFIDNSIYKRAAKNSALSAWVNILSESFVVKNVQFKIAANENSKSGITAPTVSGYEFVSWIGCASSGWLGHVYPASFINSPTTFWASSGNNTNERQVNAYALYKRVI